MAYPKEFLQLTPTQGLVSDTPAHEVGPEFFTNAENVIFRKGFVERIGGVTDTYTTALADITVPPTDLLHSINAQVNDTNYWLVFDADKAWALEGDNQTQIDDSLLTSAATQPYQYSSALLNGLPIVTNGGDEPMYWAGGDLIELTDWTATESCKSIATFRYHIFAMDIDGPGGTFPSLIKWSDAAEPGTIPDSWTPAADNEAGSVELAFGAGPILCAVPLRDQLLIYKRTTTYTAQYVGGNNKFEFRNIASSNGALNRHAVCDLGDKHLVVEQGDIVLSDGVNKESIAESKVKDFLFGQLDQENADNLFVTFDRAKKEVIIAFPTTGNTRCNAALVYNVAHNSFGYRVLSNVATATTGFVTDSVESDVWDDDAQAWDDDPSAWNGTTLGAATESLVFVYDGKLEQQDTLTNTNVEASVGKYDMTFGDAQRVKFINQLQIQTCTGFGTLLVRVGSRMTPTDTITWSPEVTLNEPDQIVNTFAVGRYISVSIRSTGSNTWCVTGIDLGAELRGYY